ncbi:MAG TPA: bifunctional phosphoribosylaminoimidazolecarboxamide formyltransferase/IMP cyclohydrolase PurH, partial [Phaeodactylibacter sp.]|nr:bifunctional phosphoribosylaminoimidazolecarboxamide formyltransferase/IMP cyclohydrolase PurH [Phaeodactylibacter sp.]
ALNLINEFRGEKPTVAVLKHTNPCGLAQRETVFEAWQAALAGDPVSAFGGIIIANTTIDEATAEAINEIFYEALVAPAFSERAKEILLKKKKRIVLQLKDERLPARQFKSLLGGVLQQDADFKSETPEELRPVTEKRADEALLQELFFANRVVKHLKSNAIAVTKNRQLIGMGCGQTSRIDALRQAIEKARRMGFDPAGSVLASDAFFPFADSVEAAHKAGISAVVQPGGSIRDQDSIAYCNQHGLCMVFSGVRHFKH